MNDLHRVSDNVGRHPRPGEHDAHESGLRPGIIQYQDPVRFNDVFMGVGLDFLNQLAGVNSGVKKLFTVTPGCP